MAVEILSPEFAPSTVNSAVDKIMNLDYALDKGLKGCDKAKNDDMSWALRQMNNAYEIVGAFP